MHPDRGGDQWNAALINEAYGVLSDPRRREAYDRELARRPSGPGFARREEAVPRLGSDRQASADGQESPARCVFCQAPCDPEAVERRDARCTRCASPLFPAARLDFAPSGQRAVSRLEQRRDVKFFTDWPQRAPHRAVLLDVSPRGVRLESGISLRAYQIVKIDGGPLQATGRVAHCARGSGGDGSWYLGIELFTLLAESGTFVSCRA
jgi:hypothetical protein